MAGIVDNRFLFGASASPEPAIVPVPTWAEAERAITALLDEGEAILATATAGGTRAGRAP